MHAADQQVAFPVGADGRAVEVAIDRHEHRLPAAVSRVEPDDLGRRYRSLVARVFGKRQEIGMGGDVETSVLADIDVVGRGSDRNPPSIAKFAACRIAFVDAEFSSEKLRDVQFGAILRQVDPVGRHEAGGGDRRLPAIMVDDVSRRQAQISLQSEPKPRSRALEVGDIERPRPDGDDVVRLGEEIGRDRLQMPKSIPSDLKDLDGVAAVRMIDDEQEVVGAEQTDAVRREPWRRVRNQSSDLGAWVIKVERIYPIRTSVSSSASLGRRDVCDTALVIDLYLFRPGWGRESATFVD